MEIRDLYDKNKKLTGKTIKKGEPVPDGNYLLVVLVMIRNSKGEFLIQKRPEGKKGLYGATGGHCKSGETGIMGAITETREELGINLNPSELAFLFGGRQEDNRTFFEVFYAQKDIDISKLKLQKDEVEDVEWMSVDRIRKLANKSRLLKYHVDEICDAINIIDIMKDSKEKSLDYEDR